MRNYDAWKTGPFGKFELQQEREAEARAEEYSTHDNRLRNNPELLLEVFLEETDSNKTWEHILIDSANFKNPELIGTAMINLVNDVIHKSATREAYDSPLRSRT